MIYIYSNILVLALFDNNHVLDDRSTTCYMVLYAIIAAFAG